MTYFQHGRRHSKYGTDPVPIPDGAWAQIHNLTGAALTGSTGIEQHISIHDTGLTDRYETSDPTVFANAATSVLTGSPLYGIQVNQPGTYKWEQVAFIRNDGAAGVGVASYWSASDGSVSSEFQFGRTAAVTGDTFDQSGAFFRQPHLSFYEYFSVSAAQLGAVGVPFIELVTGGSITVDVAVFVTKISDYVAVKLT